MSGAWRLLPAVALAAGLLIASATLALAAGPDLAAADLSGPWDLTSTVAGYTGPPSGFAGRPVGHRATDRVWFVRSCPSPGACTLQIWGPGGPDPARASYFTYFGNQSGFEGPSVASPMRQSGAGYSQSFGVQGYGGRVACFPPPGTRAPTESLTLTVTAAADRAGRLAATAVRGTEVLASGWGCTGSTFVGWDTVTLSISGVPAGQAAPAPAASSRPLTVSSLASALDPPGQAFRSPGLVVANLLLTAVVILFVTFPSALFNQTLRANEAEIKAALAPLARPLGRLRIARDWSSERGLTGFAVVVLAGGVLNGLLDPAFGLNRASLTNYAATVLTICFGVLTGGVVGYLYRRGRRMPVEWRLQALPLGLLVAAACVLVTRLTDFQPGYFYGLVCGVAFAGSAGVREKGHVAALGTVVSLTLGVVAWVLWAAVEPAARAGASPVLVLVADFLGAVFVGGLVGNVVGLLPFRSLSGRTLADWHRGVWAALFGIAVFGMVQVLLHPEQGAVHPSSAPLVTAVLLFAGFGGGSLAFNRYFAWEGRPTRLRPAGHPEPALETTGAGRGR